MLHRVARGFFGGLWVFPGGKVEEIDHSDLAREAVAVPEDADDRPWRSAALRETIEEVGVAITDPPLAEPLRAEGADRKSTRLNSSHVRISYAVFCLKKKSDM